MALILAFFFLLSEVSTCVVEIEKLNVEKSRPLFLERTEEGLRLATPSMNKWKAVLDFGNNNVIIGCPGLKNYLLYGDEMFGDRLEGSCSFAKNGRTLINIGDRLYNIYNFKCQNRPESFEIATNRSSCRFNDSTVYKVGYVVNDELFPLFGACHHEETGTTIWTRHKILGIGMVPFESNYTSPDMKTDNMIFFKKMDINEAFMPRNQRNKLEQIMGKRSKMVLKRNMDVFTKAYLVPPEDFKLNTWKDATFHFINIEFQWLPIQSGVWKSLENEIRKLAKLTDQDLTVLTGVSGYLELTDGKAQKILSMGDNPETLPVPKYFWKLIQNQAFSCIGFIVPNFPVSYVINNMANECPPCYVFGWRKLHGKDFSIKCCEYSKLKKIVPETPSMECQSILKFKKS